MDIISTDVTLNKIVTDELYERASVCYCEMIDASNTAPKITAVMDKLIREHPDDYKREYRQDYLRQLQNPQFNSYLESFREEYIKRTLASRLLAAQLGHRMGTKATERIMEALEGETELKTKDLIAIAKLGFDLAREVDHVEPAAGPTYATQVNNFFGELADKLPEEMLNAYSLELIRRSRLQAAEDVDDVA
jgi:hypothetical protein